MWESCSRFVGMRRQSFRGSYSLCWIFGCRSIPYCLMICMYFGVIAQCMFDQQQFMRHIRPVSTNLKNTLYKKRPYNPASFHIRGPMFPLFSTTPELHDNISDIQLLIDTTYTSATRTACTQRLIPRYSNLHTLELRQHGCSPPALPGLGVELPIARHGRVSRVRYRVRPRGPGRSARLVVPDTVDT